MAKTYSVFARAYAGVIKKGRRKIDDVRPDELKQDVIVLLASEGLGPDGKPLPKNHIDPKGEPGEPGIVPEDGNKEDVKEEVKEPKKPVEEVKEEPIKDTDKEDKNPVEEDKGAK